MPLIYKFRVTKEMKECNMSTFDNLPKTVKRTVRYIIQDAPKENLQDIQKIINNAIDKRLENQDKKTS
jgi:predicted DNA-binding protein